MRPESRRLLRAYIRSQAALAAVLQLRLRELWPLLLAGRLDDTTDVWADAVTGAIAVGHQRSAVLASGFFQRFGLIETGAAITATLATIEPAVIRRTMIGTGPALVKANVGSGLQFETAATKASYWAEGAGVSLGRSGGRDTIIGSAREQRVRWARAASGSACAFCAMLASRGAVYGEDTADFQAHANCGCEAVPVFSNRQALPENTDDFKSQWDEAQRLARTDSEFASTGTSNDALNNFRRLRGGTDTLTGADD